MRVSNDTTATANRLVEKVLVLFSDNDKYTRSLKKLEILSKSLLYEDSLDGSGNLVKSRIQDESADMYDMTLDYIKRVETDKASVVNTVLGMHEKMINKDFATFLEFAKNFAQSQLKNANVEKIAQFNKMFPTEE